MVKKYFINFISLLFLSSSIYSQEIKTEYENQTMLKLMPYYQSWSGINNKNIKQYSSRLFLNYFYDRDTRISLQSGYASSDVLENKISGLSDTQLSINYKLRKYNTALDLGINIPTGKEKIDAAKFPYSVLLSQDVFNMKMPILGQGTNIFAGITWANNISDNIAIGLGASYQIKGKYSPIEDDTISYKPSNEILITGGIDFRINSSTTLSGDVIGIFYGKDKINENDAYSAGAKTIFSLQFRQYYGYNNLVIFLRYRNSAVDKLNGLADVITSEKINPNSFMAFANFKHYISRNLTFNYSVEGRFYQKTVAPYSGFNIYGIGFTSNIELSSAFTLPLTIKYYTGKTQGSSSINGLELGLGLVIIF